VEEDGEDLGCGHGGVGGGEETEEGRVFVDVVERGAMVDAWLMV